MSLYDGHPEADDGSLTADGLLSTELAEFTAEWDLLMADVYREAGAQVTSILIGGLVHAGMAEDASRRCRRYGPKSALGEYWDGVQRREAVDSLTALVSL
jgi:hypothetical protein